MNSELREIDDLACDEVIRRVAVSCPRVATVMVLALGAQESDIPRLAQLLTPDEGQYGLDVLSDVLCELGPGGIGHGQVC